MNVLFLSNSLGGLKSFRMEIIQKMLKDGFNVGICSPFEIPANIFIDLGCQCFELHMSRHGLNPIKEFMSINVYRGVIRSFRPDVILSYTIKPNIYGSIAANKENVPIISSVTGLGTALENGGILKKLLISLLRNSITKSDHVFFQNQESIDYFLNNKIKPNSYSLIAGSGVNLEKFAFADYPSEDNGVHFLYIGRILEEKGIGQFLEAASVVKEKFPNAYFHIVGIKDDVKYSSLVEEFNKKGIIEYHGPQSDVRPFYEMSHCQVHPTYYPEGMSNVLLESGAVGRPAITTDKSGCKEIIQDDYNGFIVRQRDTDSLIEALTKFILLPHERKVIMGKRAHEIVASRFDRAKVINEYLSKIQDVVKDSRSLSL